MKCVWLGRPCRQATGLICNVMLIYLLSLCQLSPGPSTDYHRAKRGAGEIERHNCWVSHAVTHFIFLSVTQAILMYCHVPELTLSERAMLLMNVTFTCVRKSISEDFSLLTCTHCLQIGVGCQQCTRMQKGESVKFLLQPWGDGTEQVQLCIYWHDSANLFYLDPVHSSNWGKVDL